MDPKMDSEKTPKWTILGPILGVLKWVNFWTSKTVRLSPKKVATLHTCMQAKHFWYPPSENTGPKKWTQKWTPI